MKINGFAHVMLTAGNSEKCKAFYARICEAMGMKPLIDTNDWLYCIGGRTAFGIVDGAEEHSGERFVQQRVGLHHLCFRARTREDVDEFHDLLQELGALVVHPPQEDEWAPGYYMRLKDQE
jgi:catechol 2,3-dioxygenase-like lactoylglutathione lyase family enzyme